jgi:hypothetical protein
MEPSRHNKFTRNLTMKGRLEARLARLLIMDELAQNPEELALYEIAKKELDEFRTKHGDIAFVVIAVAALEYAEAKEKDSGKAE